MKSMLVVALVAISFAAVYGQTCTTVTNCNSCSNPGPTCEDCTDRTILSVDRTKCLSCSTNCANCTSDATDTVTCMTCDESYYLDNGVCNFCGAGCTECHLESGSIVCDACSTTGYVQDLSTTAQSCVACPSNCKTCSLATDGTTTCLECFTYVGLSTRGYYLRQSDSSCRSCPAFCEACSDDGTGTGICSTCYSSSSQNYKVFVDPNDSTNDGTKCVRCPSTCTDCSGEEFSSGIATCTSCTADSGLYLISGECISCDSNCKTCDTDGLCTDCNIDYRVDGGSCSACSPFCQTCSVDDSTGVESCSTCDDNYGTKESTSITCDACGISNCGVCTRSSSTGAMSCSSCKTGYGFDSSGSCTSCGTGCTSCTYDTDHMRCTACESTGYTATVYPTAANSAIATPSACSACPSECTACDFDASGNVVCSACITGYYVDSSGSLDVCTVLPANCLTGDGANGTCLTCNEGYDVNAGACDACTASSCTACATSLATCDGCILGYGFVDTDFDNVTDACESCGISRCEKCITWGGYSGASKLCFQCETGYIHYDSAAGSRRATLGGSCKKCPTGCNTCTVDYSTSNDATTCSSNGCASWDGTRAYVNDDAGGCAQCPTKCQSCTYDSSTQSTICDSNQCDGVYAKNDNTGECEACPDNCDACEWDASTSTIVCTDNQCSTSYGKISDGTCSTCPNNCDVCSISTATDADDTLFCDTCSTGYGTNSDVCAKCPTNCKSCTDSSGSMSCNTCKDGYALDTSGSCTRCPTNCNTCTASGSLLCTDCNSGYALAGDKLSCTACSTAAFDNCATCGDVNATTAISECMSCSSGWTLEDEENNLSCVSTATLICNGGDETDNGPECSTCATGFTLTDDFECAIMCYTCGDISANTFVDQASCQIPTAGSNVTENMATLEECTIGACYAAYNGGQVMAGCLPQTFNGAVCGLTFQSGEVCSTVDSSTLCQQCCITDSCNTFVATLDGLSDSGASFMVNALLLAVCALFAASL